MMTRYVVLFAILATYPACAENPKSEFPGAQQRGTRPMLEGNIERALRYSPDETDIIITNGKEAFNRPLYGGSSAFRVDGGDVPEFSFYLPGRGGNLRYGLKVGSQMKWLNEASEVEFRYRNGYTLHSIKDPLLGNGSLRITTICPASEEGLLVQVESIDTPAEGELIVTYGGIQGERGGRDGDIGCERLPVNEFFRFKPDYCDHNRVLPGKHSAIVQSSAGAMVIHFPHGTSVRVGDATYWDKFPDLIKTENKIPTRPVVIASIPFKEKSPIYLGFQHIPAKQATDDVIKAYQKLGADEITNTSMVPIKAWSYDDLPKLFQNEQQQLSAIAGKVIVKTPDPFVNAALPSVNIASNAVWDSRAGVYVHGGVAWRTPLLGWRVAYSGDVLGWSERTRKHFDHYVKRQNTDAVPENIPVAESQSFLARNETALHSNGDMTQSHYDMNMVGIDVIFRHLLWTGDLDYARLIWPVIERHLAWERRLFRREYGPVKLPLYEAYCCIWASDTLAYNGGGATHATAYNLYHNRMAARIAHMIGKDPAPYENEAMLINKGMKQLLWLGGKGWFAESKDLLGDQATADEAAAWTFYHTVDSEVPNSLESWQMCRFVDTRLPHIPVRGPNVPDACYTISTTSWMPWVWSLNNVVMAESMHTAHALWQANDIESAFHLFKGALLDSMYLGICPGNVGMCTWYDVNRRESQRDFGDGVGATSRAFVEGLFGITPNMLDGTLKIRPGFPHEWNDASIQHPSFDFSFHRQDETENYKVVSRFGKPVNIRLELTALRDEVVSITANGKPVAWQWLSESVAQPRIAILVPAAAEQNLVIQWAGTALVAPPAEINVNSGASCLLDAGATIIQLADPQRVLSQTTKQGGKLTGVATGVIGHRTLFAQVLQGQAKWWQPLQLNISETRPAKSQIFNTDWTKVLEDSVKLDPVTLTDIFNETVAEIFKQNYDNPRSPYCSLALPRHGYGSWCHPKDSFDVNDSGLRAMAALNHGRINLPNGVPLLTPGDPTVRNIAFVSRWARFPQEITVPITGRAKKLYLLMAGSTDAMKSRRDNGEIIVAYHDGTTTRLALENPTTWWPIDQDYFIDDFAFRRPGPLPVRVDLSTGKIRVLDPKTFAGKGRSIPGGAATVLDLDLDPSKEVKCMTVRAIANEVVIGLMSATLQRP